MIGPATPDPTLVTSTLKPVGEHTFRVETTDGYGVPAELVVFETDAAGRVTRARFGENYTERIDRLVIFPLGGGGGTLLGFPFNRS